MGRWGAAAGTGSRGTLAAVRGHWQDRQYRNGYYLMLNSVVGGAAGLLFWLVLVRAYAFPAADVGLGLAVVSLCTALALLAKGGLDTALVRHVPRTTPEGGRALLRLATLVALGATALLAGTLGLAWLLGLPLLGLDAAGLGLVALLTAVLAVTWLQDAHFLAAGEARLSFHRNLVLHGGRLAAPALVVALAVPYPIPVAWGAALGLSLLAALALARRLPAAPEPGAVEVPRPVFLRSAARNLTGTAAEFLPGLLLPPLVLHLEGPEAAAHFGIAWTGAAVLFLISAAMARSSLAEMARGRGDAAPLRRAARQHLVVLGPATVGALGAGPFVLGLFGPTYASQGLPVFLLLAASTVLVAPVYLYLALLRSREERGMLVLFPLALVLALFSLAPPLQASLGLVGVGVAWVLVHVPLAIFATVRLRRALQEVTHAPDAAPAQRGAPHLE